MKVIVLVAGFATRLYPITEKTPKALLTVGKKTLLDYLFDKLEKIDDITEAILISNEVFYENFTQWKNNYKGWIPVKVLNDGATSNETRLGAIGDMQYVIDECKIDEDLMVLASDHYFQFDLKEFYDFFKAKDADCVAGKVFEDIEYIRNRFGVAVLDKDGKIIEMIEKPSDPPSNFVAFAFYLYKKETVPMIKQYLDEGNKKDSPGNFPSWLHKKKDMFAFELKGECVDIGTISDYEAIKKRFN